jgi:hypothetical protein
MKKFAYGMVIMAFMATAFIFTQAFTTPPAGFVPKYMWTGARTIAASVSVTVNCTNFHPTAASTVHVEIVDFNGTTVGSGTVGIAPGETRTTTGGTATAFFSEDSTIALTSDLNQGSVRVSAQGSKKVICSAHVLDVTSAPPTFIQDLTTFSPNGLKF